MFRRWVANIIANKSGNVLMLAAASLPIVIGAAGLATDTVQWTLWKRQVQREADSAALAGAYAISQGFSASAGATADINRLSLVPLTQAAIVENAPTTGSYAGNTNAVRVVLKTTQDLPFSRILGFSAPVITGDATAAIVGNGNYCVVSLDNSANVGITLQGNATVNLGCGMITNSQAANAVYAGGSSAVTASPVAAVGGLQSSSNYLSPTTLLPYSLPQPDPFATLPTPAPSGCASQVNVNSNSTSTIEPGCYKGFNVKGTLNLNPGVYYVDSGTFSLGAQATLNGTGVTIILTSSSAGTNPNSVATLNINGGATVNLSATTTGTYAGVLFYQDRRALDSGTNQMNGNASSFLQGAFYFPSQELQFSGTAGMSTDCLQLVSKRVTFIGNSSVANDCPTNSGAQTFSGTRIKLVA